MNTFHKVKIVLLVLLFAISIVAAYAAYSSAPERQAFEFVSEMPVEGTATMRIAYVSGEVNKPGIFEVSEKSTVAQLIELAGGFTANADARFVSQNINLAAQVEDRQHIFIPAVAPTTEEPTSSGLVNINTASEAELDTLPGIGPSLATTIISSRPYKSIDDLKNVKGIGESKYAQIKALITI